MHYSVPCRFLLCYAFSLSLSPITAQLLSTGSTVELGGVPYYVPSAAVLSLPTSFYVDVLAGANASDHPWIPITVVTASSKTLSIAGLKDILRSYNKNDDVWTNSFLQGIILVETTLSPSEKSLRVDTATVTSRVLSFQPEGNVAVAPGPYLLSADGGVYQPWRLYADIEGAFTQPLIPSSVTTGSYAALPATVPGIASPGVAVPSRLYYTKSSSKPIAGVRFGVKDVFDVAGVRTSDGNRAYYGLYPPRTRTAGAIQRLIDAGGVLVGKMKTSQFANGEVATADWVDYHEPFNARGDGYQDSSSSSSGPGSGEGSYPWLDLSLGSDTGGSVRDPSRANGVYGNRPTHGIVPLTEAIVLAPQLDTAGLLCRDPMIWTAAAGAIYGGLPAYNKFPKKLRVIGLSKLTAKTDDPLTRQSNKMVLTFLSKFATFLGAEVADLNYTTLWDQTKPDPGLPALIDVINTTYATLIGKEQTKYLRDPFYADYATAHDGRLPFIDPVPLARWKYADSLPASALDEAVNNKTIFMKWWENNVTPAASNDAASCLDNFVLYIEAVEIVYRNTYLSPPTPPFGLSQTRIAIFTEVPDFVVPLGMVAYNSTITNHTEYLPVTVDILAGRGCDGLIFSLVEKLLAAGIISVPQAGQTANGGEILLKRRSFTEQ